MSLRSSRAPTDRVAVLLCAELASAGTGLDLPGILRWLEAKDPGVAARVLPGLCERPQGLGRILQEEKATRVVLGLCGGRYAHGEIQAHMRRAGIDPLSLEVVDLGRLCARVHPAGEATERAKILLAAAAARARAFPGSGPANVKPYLLARVSRHGLLRFPPLGYQAVPSMREERCVGDAGCTLCVQTCPYDALAIGEGEVRLQKPRCTSCGLCVTACPREAILFPGYAPEQVEAQVRTLLDPATGDIQIRGILYACPHSPFPEASHPGWMPVFLPSLAMAPPTWFLAPLVMGARAVGILPCSGGCPPGHDEVVRGRVTFCQDLLERVGASADLVRLDPPVDRPPGGEGTPPGLRGHLDGPSFSPDPATMAGVLCQIAEAFAPGTRVELDHPLSPLGIVEVQGEICTGCGMCGRVCPTDALVFEEVEGQALLHFHPARCTACGHCLPICPEGERGAIRVRRVFHQARLQEGKTVVYRGPLARCVRCGAPIAPNRMLERVTALLGDEDPTLRAVLTRYCSSCRIVGGGL